MAAGLRPPVSVGRSGEGARSGADGGAPADGEPGTAAPANGEPGTAGGPDGGTGSADERELVVESIAAGGDGVAREASGRVVFVPRSAPGDRLVARLSEEHDSWARARPVRLLEAGPRRQEPPCPYYGGCGGCQLQHLERAAELEAKREVVRDALERIGGLSPEVEPVRDPGPPLGYRNRIALTLRRGGGSVRAGYHRWDAPSRLVDVRACPLAEEPVNRAWNALREAWGPEAGRLPAGRELRLTLRASKAGATALLVEGGRDPKGEPEAVAGAVPDLNGYSWRPARGHRRLLAGEHDLPESWEGVDLELGPESFVQVNRVVAASIEEHLDRLVAERMGGPAGSRMLDLYAGVGLRALRWAEAGARTVACERDEAAVEAGRRAAERRGTEVAFHAADVEERLDALLPADLAVVNPPRAGLSGAVAGRLADADVGVVAYVSCDPATLARDLDRMGARWRIVSVQPFDAFPQTAHVETVVWLEAA